MNDRFQIVYAPHLMFNLFSQQMGGQRYEDVEKTKVECFVLPGIECYGDRKFLRDGVPCIKYVSFFRN